MRVLGRCVLCDVERSPTPHRHGRLRRSTLCHCDVEATPALYPWPDETSSLLPTLHPSRTVGVRQPGLPTVRLSRAALGTSKSRSRTNVLVVTLAPPSRYTQGSTLSKPLSPKNPCLGTSCTMKCGKEEREHGSRAIHMSDECVVGTSQPISCPTLCLHVKKQTATRQR